MCGGSFDRENKSRQLEELQVLIDDPGFWSDQDRSTRVLQQRARLEETLNIVDAVGYASAYSFKYSPRPGTPAAVMEDQIERDVMDERLQRLQLLLGKHQQAFNAAKLGTDTQILIEREGRDSGQKIGKSPWFQSVHVDTAARPGDIIQVTLTGAGPRSMTGAIRQRAAA